MAAGARRAAGARWWWLRGARRVTKGRCGARLAGEEATRGEMRPGRGGGGGGLVNVSAMPGANVLAIGANTATIASRGSRHPQQIANCECQSAAVVILFV